MHEPEITESPALILHVIHHLFMGGMENGLVNLVNHIPDSRYKHAIVCVEDYSDFRNRITRPDVEVFALERSRIGVRRLQLGIFRLCRKLRPSIVHTRNMSGLDALLPARLAGVRHCIHGEHGWDVGDLHGEKWKPLVLRKLHAPMVSSYVTVSRHLSQYLIDKVGISRNRITQIYNGVNTKRFTPVSAGKTRGWLPQHFQADNLFIVGTVGRLQPVKSQVTLLRAAARIIHGTGDQGRRLRILMVGDGPLRESLRSEAEALKIDASVHFAGASESVPDALRAIDVFALPSLSEGISNTLLEAMACGLPAVATAVGGNVELVTDGVNGRLFRAGDEAGLASLLAGYLQNPDQCAAHGLAALEQVRQHFSLSAMVANYVGLYDSVLARS